MLLYNNNVSSANKGTDAAYISNILNHNKVKNCITIYFKLKSTPVFLQLDMNHCIKTF